MQLRGIGANVGGPQVKVSIFIAGIAILAVLLLAALAIAVLGSAAPTRTPTAYCDSISRGEQIYRVSLRRT
jgi:hypothetical protein